MKSKDLIITKNPKSLFAESIRSIRTNIAFASLDKEVKIIINTSPEAGDGKSFITSKSKNRVRSPDGTSTPDFYAR